MLGLEKYLHDCGLEVGLLHLIKLRASQINGCAYCLDMHWKDLKSIGETEQRMYSLDAWRECPYYTDRERAALAWTDSETRIADTHAPDEVYEEVKKHLTKRKSRTSPSLLPPSMPGTDWPSQAERRRAPINWRKRK